MAVKLDVIRSAAQRVAASHGLDVVDLEFTGPAKDRILRVYLEKDAEGRARLKADLAAGDGEGESAIFPERLREGTLSVDQLSWVTHEDCERFSRDFGTVIDVEGLMTVDDYTLEVSSPGLDRKLATRADYERFQASLVKLQTFTPVAGNRHWLGKLTEVRPEGIVLDLTAKKQKTSKKGPAPVQTIEIAFANIEKANLAPEI